MNHIKMNYITVPSASPILNEILIFLSLPKILNERMSMQCFNQCRNPNQLQIKLFMYNVFLQHTFGHNCHFRYN